MGEWKEYRYEPEMQARYRNEHGDEVLILDMLLTDATAVYLSEQYHVRYKPARSDIVTTVPNGRFSTFEEALSFAERAAMPGNIQYIEDRKNR